MYDADALLADGYVVAASGTFTISSAAQSKNILVIVCCETYKLSEPVQTDAIVNNEFRDPPDLLAGKCNTVKFIDEVNDESISTVVTEHGAMPFNP